MNLRLALITLFIYSFLAAAVYAISIWSKRAPLLLALYPREILVNTPIYFADSTVGNSSTVWEFGNGDKKRQKKGLYYYNHPGDYVVRATLGNALRDTFLIHVRPQLLVYKKDSSVYISAGRTSVVGESVPFKALGPGILWCEWSFGESGKIDAREAEAFHAFSATGIYKVQLTTNLNPTKPLYHVIRISKPYKIEQAVPVKKKEPEPAAAPSASPEDMLKKNIQSIAQGGNFNSNYASIVQQFLCSNPRTPVVVNSKAPIDFYSYCHSLHLSNGIKIDQVTPEINPKTNCPSRLIIQQH